jgi:putative oxidoreductase
MGGSRCIYLVLLGRLLFALIFISAAPRHFSQEGIRHAADLGTPVACIFVPLSGVMALAGGLSVAVGYKARWGAWLLVAFLVPVTLIMHPFWRAHIPENAHIQLAMFSKNLSMIGAALLLTQFGAGGASLDARR